MGIVLNGKPYEIAEGATIAELLKQLELNPDVVSIRVNQRAIAKDALAAGLAADDQVEILLFMGGGF